MRLQIENIGMVRRADIKLDGLTIIAGENDTGKSTVGKLMFSLVKAFTRYEQDLKERKSDRVLYLVEKIYIRLRRNFDLMDEEIINKEFFPPRFIRDIQKFPENIKENIDGKISILKKLGDESGIRDLKSIERIYFDIENKDSVIKRALQKALFSEFYSELSPMNTNLTSSISISEGIGDINNPVLNISMRNNLIEKLSLHDDLFINDSTYIETPILLQMSSLISTTPTLFEVDGMRIGREKSVSLHAKDLISKMQNAEYYGEFNDEHLTGDLLEKIKEITKGFGFSFEKKSREFYFNKSEEVKFRATNTATGLKSFGVIQLLAQAGFLNERSLLIIDEPEIHLHPKWQIEYARLIAILVKNSVPVLVTSHSPEIIQALTIFSELYKIDDKTNYYLAESDGTSSEILDVTKNINKIFIKLTTPLSNLMGGFYHA